MDTWLPTSVAALLLSSLLAGPAAAEEPSGCTQPASVRATATHDEDSSSRKITLTFHVDDPCEPAREHGIYVAETPAGVPAECPRGRSRPVASLTAPAGATSTVTLVVEPLYSTDYQYGIIGQAYSSGGPRLQVAPRHPAPAPPPPTLSADQVRLVNGSYVSSVVAGQPVSVRVHGTDCTVDLVAQTARAPGERIIRTQRPDTGTATVRFDLRPTDNTIVWGWSRDTATANGGLTSKLFIEVRRAVTFSAQRVGPRRFVFSGRVSPATAGVPVQLHRFDDVGRRVLVARGATDSSGVYRIDRTFSGSGGFPFVVTTAADRIAGAGASPERLIAVR